MWWISGAPVTVRSSIPVRCATKGGIGCRGSTSVWNVDSRSPPRYVTAPTSVMAWSVGEPPVVSRSTTTNVTSESFTPSAKVHCSGSRSIGPPSAGAERGRSPYPNRCSGVKSGSERAAGAPGSRAPPRSTVPLGSDREVHPSVRPPEGRRAGEPGAELVAAVRRRPLEPRHVARVQQAVVIAVTEPGHHDGLRGDLDPVAAYAMEERDADTHAGRRGLEQTLADHGGGGEPPVDGEPRGLL